MPGPTKLEKAAGAPAASWTKKYSVDWVAEFSANGAHDFKTGGAYTDQFGATYDIADHTIQGDSATSVLSLAAGGLVITTSSNTEIAVCQQIADLIGDYDLGDKLAWVVEFDDSTMVSNWQRFAAFYGLYPSNIFQQQLRYDGSTGLEDKRKQSSPVSANSSLNRYAPATAADVLGLEIQNGTWAEAYYGSAVPSEPFNSMVQSSEPMSMIRDPSDFSTDPFSKATAQVGCHMRSNSGPNLTYTIKSFTLWRWEA